MCTFKCWGPRLRGLSSEAILLKQGLECQVTVISKHRNNFFSNIAQSTIANDELFYPNIAWAKDIASLFWNYSGPDITPEPSLLAALIYDLLL